MAIQDVVTVTIAEVEVNDEYRVELRTPQSRRHVTDLSPDDAYRLADELTEAAVRASEMMRTDLASRGVPVIRHGFDADGPVAS